MTQKGGKYTMKELLVLVVNIFFVRGYYRQKIEGEIYILVWTPIVEMPFGVTQSGHSAFTRRRCSFKNCFVTDEHSYFNNILDFDVIMFNIIGLTADMNLPPKRSENQKYVLVATEPVGAHTIPREFNNFFNLTWTYKLDSDVPFPYIIVKNEKNERIGPKREMHWIDIKDMNKTSNYTKNKLQRKKIAAMWFATDCDGPNRPLEFVANLKMELAKYNHTVDVYGNCGEIKCPLKEIERCYEFIESTYYFYLTFENSLCEDYVTEKVLTGFKHYAVPVVYGSANYTRFLPHGIYLNAYTLGPAKLAQNMAKIISNKETYYEYFKWHGYYSFHYTAEDDFRAEFCGLCALFNNKTIMAQKTIYHTNLWFNEWYDGPPVPYISDSKLVIDEKKKNTNELDEFMSNLHSYDSV